MSDVERASGAARRRRERRLRSWLKHERQTVRMVLAETFHHSSAPFPPKFKEKWVGRHEQHDALRGQNTARTREATFHTSKTSVAGDTAFFSLFDEEDAVWGTRPTGLVEPQGPQERVQRHGVEQLADFAPMVQILDVPVPQLAEQLVEVPTAVTHVPGRALFTDLHGHEWCPVVGPTGVYFWRVLTPSGNPRRDTPPAEGGI